VFFASLAGNYLGQIDLDSGHVTVLEPPVPDQGARRIWSDSRGGLWITGWNSGDLFRYDSKTKSWARWHLPGNGPQPYAVYVDETDAVWVSDWSANAILCFDPKTEKFEAFPRHRQLIRRSREKATWRRKLRFKSWRQRRRFRPRPGMSASWRLCARRQWCDRGGG